jgi:hypothetical protein
MDQYAAALYDDLQVLPRDRARAECDLMLPVKR